MPHDVGYERNITEVSEGWCIHWQEPLEKPKLEADSDDDDDASVACSSIYPKETLLATEFCSRPVKTNQGKNMEIG